MDAGMYHTLSAEVVETERNTAWKQRFALYINIETWESVARHLLRQHSYTKKICFIKYTENCHKCITNVLWMYYQPGYVCTHLHVYGSSLLLSELILIYFHLLCFLKTFIMLNSSLCSHEHEKLAATQWGFISFSDLKKKSFGERILWRKAIWGCSSTTQQRQVNDICLRKEASCRSQAVHSPHISPGSYPCCTAQWIKEFILLTRCGKVRFTLF